MAREEYQQALSTLREDVVAMGNLALSQLDGGLEALETEDEAVARRVIDGDAELNELYLEIESDCIDLFALQQPVAGDLRFVAASFKILTDLERIGDLAGNLAEYSLSADGGHLPSVGVGRIGADVRSQVATALRAYDAGDAEACREVAAGDEDIDVLCARASDRIVRDLIEREADTDAWAVERLMDDVTRTLLTIRDLERVGDHAENIAARTLYMTDNDDELIY